MVENGEHEFCTLMGVLQTIKTKWTFSTVPNRQNGTEKGASVDRYGGVWLVYII